MEIPFNRPYLTGAEAAYLADAMTARKLSGNGAFTKRAHAFFATRYGIRKPLLTTSCTDALEMCALLLDVGPGDEVILPSFTFVSPANAFALRGATLLLADSHADHPNVDPASVEALVTPRTKAIVVDHYAGVACDMDALLAIARRHGLALVEDAAQAIDARYRGRPLGGIGDLGTFSFHETKNVIAGEGGLLAVNDARYGERAEILWEKGTNRTAFTRGEVSKYSWVDLGSSFLPSELTAAFLCAQLERLGDIQARRHALYARYREGFRAAGIGAAGIGLPHVPAYAQHNAHIFYLVCGDREQRRGLIDHLRRRGIHAVFHYLSLHRSPYYAERHGGRALPNCERYSECLVRLPLFYELRPEQVDRVVEAVVEFLRPSGATA